jgi:hypothetical protein
MVKGVVNMKATYMIKIEFTNEELDLFHAFIEHKRGHWTYKQLGKFIGFTMNYPRRREEILEYLVLLKDYVSDQMKFYPNFHQLIQSIKQKIQFMPKSETDYEADDGQYP